MITEKYFVCLENLKSVEIACDENSCSLELSYYNNDTTTWTSKSKKMIGREKYEKAYQTIMDGLKNGERFVEINFSE